MKKEHITSVVKAEMDRFEDGVLQAATNDWGVMGPTIKGFSMEEARGRAVVSISNVPFEDWVRATYPDDWELDPDEPYYAFASPWREAAEEYVSEYVRNTSAYHTPVIDFNPDSVEYVTMNPTASGYELCLSVEYELDLNWALNREESVNVAVV